MTRADFERLTRETIFEIAVGENEVRFQTVFGTLLLPRISIGRKRLLPPVSGPRLKVRGVPVDFFDGNGILHFRYGSGGIGKNLLAVENIRLNLGADLSGF